MPVNREDLPRNRKVLVVTRRRDAGTVQLVLMLVFSTDDESYICVDGKEIGDVFHSEGDALQGIALAKKYLVRAVRNGSDLEARDGIGRNPDPRLL